MSQLEDIANSNTAVMQANPRTPRVSDIQSVVEMQQRRLSHDRRYSAASGLGPTSSHSWQDLLLEGPNIMASPETPHGNSTSGLFSPVSGVSLNLLQSWRVEDEHLSFQSSLNYSIKLKLLLGVDVENARSLMGHTES
jgi:hypothetical protein